MAAHEIRFVLKNATTKPTRLFLRPWGNIYSMEVGSTYEVRAVGPSAGALYIAQVEGGTVVQGWTGSALSVHEVTAEQVSDPVDSTSAAREPRIELCLELSRSPREPRSKPAKRRGEQP